MSTTEWTDEHFVGGHPVLDLANTVYRRLPEVGPDLLTDPEALQGWFEHTGLLSPGTTVPRSSVEAARRLRVVLWDVLEPHLAGRPISTSAVDGLLGTARHALGDVVLHPDGSTTAGTADGALSSIALRAVTLLLEPPRPGVRACDRCGWFFIDSSRGRRRRWCSMRTCGNQAKAARFRASHR